ncbi:PREDICTED: biogenesis of lysosome-related organelles complex 1 subunit 4 isoform X1 [Polistes dominula]|uniref:Biogenesis of lysosome-related organelles complex 1 subunit 4 isoform X1 n=1 Tax=Polistes dominula TaxID=743375 RepID=A0ABM1I5A0_POLDO|nr:PREDICTED: biogenesis of lysosome-related organelles complex 1 subunit 4 isoform X1 [Polistes dominula]
MSSSHNENMIEELAKDYADYAKVNLSVKMKQFHETIEDVMIRLEEFQSIVGMVQAESSECMNEHIPRIRHMQKELVTLCRKIDALEHVLIAANVSLTALETAVDTAEAELGVTDRFFGILNPLSFFNLITEKIPGICDRKQTSSIPVPNYLQNRRLFQCGVIK